MSVAWRAISSRQGAVRASAGKSAARPSRNFFRNRAISACILKSLPQIAQISQMDYFICTTHLKTLTRKERIFQHHEKTGSVSASGSQSQSQLLSKTVHDRTPLC